MKPKFKDAIAWEQAELLIQPAYIRTIDNIQKQLTESGYQGDYEEIQTPYPSHLLHLTHGERSVSVDLWDLCFQVCFLDYHPSAIEMREEEAEVTQEVEIDTSLMDESGNVDWHRLETKTQQLVREVFASLS